MFHVNDGRSLAAVADGSVDLIFSFDSLVHVEADVMLAYLEQLAHKLTPHGIGFSSSFESRVVRGSGNGRGTSDDRQFLLASDVGLRRGRPLDV
jgi:hypothetical protein